MTEATSTADSGIYCVRLLGGVDPSDAVVSAAGSAVGVYTVPASPDCAFGELEIDTFILVESTTTTPGTPAPPGSADGGFAAAHGPGCRFG